MRRRTSPISQFGGGPMRRFISILAVAVGLAMPTPACADYADAAIAYNHRDYPLARRLFVAAATGGDSRSMLMLGLMNDNGLGAPRDSRVAFAWYLKAALAGESRAMFNLYQMYAEGDGVAADMAEARRWLEQSAEHGFAEAQYCWAELLHRGDGVARDDESALMWLEIVSHVRVGGVGLAIALREQLRAAMPADVVEAAQQRARQWQLRHLSTRGGARGLAGRGSAAPPGVVAL